MTNTITNGITNTRYYASCDDILKPGGIASVVSRPKISFDTFLDVCGEFLIEPGIALESDELREFLSNGCTKSELREFMNENF